MSPRLFDVDVNLFITNLGEANIGCYVDGLFWDRFLHAIVVSTFHTRPPLHAWHFYATSKHLSPSFNCIQTPSICLGY